jgi:hypothetical protein
VIRRFVPPAVAVLARSPDADLAQAIASARDEGFAEGREAGLREGYAAGQRDGHDAASTSGRAALDELQQKFAKHQAVLAIETALEQVWAARDSDLRELEDATRTIIVETLGLLFPTLLRQAVGQEIASLVTAALTERAPEQLVLRAGPETLRLAEVREQPGRLVIQEAADMPPGTAEIVWAGGGLSFDPSALQARLAAILLPFDKESTE